MPVDERPYSEAPDNAERTANRDAFPRAGRVRVVDVVAAAAVTSIDMAAIGLAARHIRLTVRGANPVAYFFQARSSATPPVQTTPDSTARATYDALGKETASPGDQATQLESGDSVRRFCSGKFPMLQINGVGGVATIELEDATI